MGDLQTKLGWYLKYFTDTAIRKRHCHMCQEEIQPTERHLAFQYKGKMWQGRRNVCVLCVEDILKNLKSQFNRNKASLYPNYKLYKKDKMLNRLIEEL